MPLSMTSMSSTASMPGERHVLVGILFLMSMVITTCSIVYLGPLMGLLMFASCGVLLVCFISIQAGLILFVLAILFSPEIDLSMGTLAGGRAITVRLEDLLAVGFFLGWLARLAILREYRLMKRTDLNVPIAALIVVSLVATFRGVGMGTVIPTAGFLYLLKYMQFYFIFFLVANYTASFEAIKRLLVFGLMGVLAYCAYAYFQIPAVQQWGHRLSVPFGAYMESTSIGAVLAFSMAVLISLLIYVRETRARFWMMAGLFFIAIPFFYTLSRTGYAAFAFMVLLIAMVSRNKPILFVMLLLALLAPFLMPDLMWERIAYTWRDARMLGVDSSTQERILLHLKAWHTITVTPLHFFFGYGVSAFGILDGQYARTAIETGVLGLGATVWIFAVIYKTAVRVFRNTRITWVKGLSLGYLAGFCGLLLHGLGAITFTIIRVMEMFWLMTGLLFAYAAVMDKAEAELLKSAPSSAQLQTTG
jgi:hypothetical protein